MPLSDYRKTDPHPTVEMLSVMGESDKIEVKDYSMPIIVGADAPNQVRQILEHHLPVWLDLFQMKSREYGDAAFDLGERAQFVDMSRKFVKLRTAIWDGEEETLTTESVDEILLDLIGHCFLTLEMRRRQGKQAPAAPPVFKRGDSDTSGALKALPIGAQVVFNTVVGTVIGHPGYTEDTDQEGFASSVGKAVDEARPHPYKQSDWSDGRLCTEMVTRDDAGDQCGLLDTDPIHATDPVRD